MLAQSQHGTVVSIGIDKAIGYDQIRVDTVGRDDQAMDPGLEFEQLMTFDVLQCIKEVFLYFAYCSLLTEVTPDSRAAPHRLREWLIQFLLSCRSHLRKEITCA